VPLDINNGLEQSITMSSWAEPAPFASAWAGGVDCPTSSKPSTGWEWPPDLTCCPRISTGLTVPGSA